MNWEQRKLGEVADIIGGGTPSTSKDEYIGMEILIGMLQHEIADQINVECKRKKDYSKKVLMNSSAKMLPVGTVLFILSVLDIGKMAIFDAKNPAPIKVFNQSFLMRMRFDSYFILIHVQRQLEEIWRDRRSWFDIHRGIWKTDG